MAIFKIELDQSTYEKLVAIAIREIRPTAWQAELMLRRAILRDSGDSVQECQRGQGSEALVCAK
jgi:hypothetical protein